MIPVFTVVIPSRFASTRLPGKPLQMIAGKPMVQHVWEQACKSSAQRVVVATDDARIVEACKAFGAEVLLTRADHESGTDRLAEVATRLGWADDDVVVNVQGDEPLIPPELISAAAAALAADPDAAIATACHPLASADEFFNSNVVKLVLDARGRALYFSRAPIPWARDAFAADRDALPAGLPAYRHIGLYAYRAGFLKRYTTLAPSPLEQWEALEQLRAMAHGYPIQVMVLDHAPPAGVDTADDLERVRRVFDRA